MNQKSILYARKIINSPNNNNQNKTSQAKFQAFNWYYWNVKLEDNLNSKNKYTDWWLNETKQYFALNACVAWLNETQQKRVDSREICGMIKI